MEKQSSTARKRPKAPSPEKQESNRNDKILKENLKSLIPVLLRRVLNLTFDSLEFLPVTKQQTTLEREPDFICIVKNAKHPKGILLHIEFETQPDAEMAERIHEYLAIERRRHKLDVLPVVIYVGAGQPSIPNSISQVGLEFSFPVYFLNRHPFTDFINASTLEEVTMAILADFEGRSSEEAIRLILARLNQLKKNRHHLNKFLTQLRMFSRLRNLQPQTQNLIKAMNIFDIFSIENDIVYQEGRERGLAEGELKGKLEGEAKGQDLKDHVGTFNMLDLGFATDMIGGILEIEDSKVEAIKKLWELDKKIKELAAAERKTIAQTAKWLNVKRDVFDKLKEIESERKKR